MEEDGSDPARPRPNREEAKFLAQAAEAFERLRALEPSKRDEPLAALDPVLRREVVRPGLAMGERLKRFRLEAEALGRLKGGLPPS